MPTTISNRLRLSEHDKLVLAEYWRFFEPLAPAINKELRVALVDVPAWAPLLKSISPQAEVERNARSLALQGEAMRDGNWGPYLDDLRAQGIAYARMGVSFIAWYDLIAIYRELIRARLVDLGKSDYARAATISEGLNRGVDIAMAHVGEAYLAAKEQIIADQQAAIRELSLPVLQVSDRLLVIPLVGMIDSSRARLLIESLLTSIRDRRARGVVIDVTGVPIVDTAVANHLVQACEAAKLMGAIVVITGISPEMAQTLVTLGARLPAAETHVDLQEGIEQITVLLASPATE